MSGFNFCSAMRVPEYIISFLLVSFLLLSCDKDKDIDTEKPLIDLSLPDAFPRNCDTLYFGESFDFRVIFTDNAGLGSYSIGIHHNFDHHSHSTEVTECNPGPKKPPVNPFSFIADYDIPAGLTEYQTNLSVTVPSGNGAGLFDEGDYHFFISLTDREGWSAQKGLSIRMLHR
jgi:hypothetical protein